MRIAGYGLPLTGFHRRYNLADKVLKVDAQIEDRVAVDDRQPIGHPAFPFPHVTRVD
jgi:hypothetical protein